MRIPIPSKNDVPAEDVKWPTVAFEHSMAAAVAKGKKKKKNRFKDLDEDMY